MRFPGPLLLAVFLRVLLEMIRSAHGVKGMDIDLGSHFSKISLCLLRLRLAHDYNKIAGTEEIINT